MSTITETMWEIITDSDELPAELTNIMRQEYEPFLTHEKATCVNTSKLEQSVREQLIKWYEWLPETPASQRGRELAMEAFHGEDGRPPEETQHAVRLTAETVLRLIAQPDEQGAITSRRWAWITSPAYLGYLVGYLGGPLASDEAAQYRKGQGQQEYLGKSIAV